MHQKEITSVLRTKPHQVREGAKILKRLEPEANSGTLAVATGGNARKRGTLEGTTIQNHTVKNWIHLAII
jgi:hypothetical protein